MLKKKMLIAPILAVALVLSLTAAVSYLPLSAQTALQNQPSTSPTSTPAPNFVVTPSSPSAGNYNVQTPAPTSSAPPIAAPTAAPASISNSNDFLPIMFAVVAVVLGVVAVQVLFREKELRKQLNGETQ